MKPRFHRRVLPLALIAAVAAAGAGGIAYAVIPDSVGVVHSCYVKKTGGLRVIDDASQKCTAAEAPLEFYSRAGSEAAFLGESAKAADSDLVDGKDASEFLGASAKAADADKLDGIDSAGFVRGSASVLAAQATLGSGVTPDEVAILQLFDLGNNRRFLAVCDRRLESAERGAHVELVVSTGTEVWLDDGGENPHFGVSRGVVSSPVIAPAESSAADRVEFQLPDGSRIVASLAARSLGPDVLCEFSAQAIGDFQQSGGRVQ